MAGIGIVSELIAETVMSIISIYRIRKYKLQRKKRRMRFRVT